MDKTKKTKNEKNTNDTYLVRAQLGKDAEHRAEAWFLENRTARLLARNYRCKWGEIDLIFEEAPTPSSGPARSPKSQKTRELVFVEVKARGENPLVDGPQSVGWRKQNRLQRTVSHFLLKYKGPAKTMRMDLLYWDGKSWEYLSNIGILEA